MVEFLVVTQRKLELARCLCVCLARLTFACYLFQRRPRVTINVLCVHAFQEVLEHIRLWVIKSLLQSFELGVGEEALL